jgi:alpha-glucoside transport system permease protein
MSHADWWAAPRVTSVALIALIGSVGVPAVLVGYITLVEAWLQGMPERRRSTVRPWLWLAPALALLGIFLVYPAVRTLYLSVLDAESSRFVGFQNYLFAVTSPEMLDALRNNLLWLTMFTTIAVGVGLAMAVLTDRVRYEAVARSVMFMPMAISFVAASVTWKFVYAFRPAGEPQIGALNALLSKIVPHFHPVAWLVAPALNNVALIAVGVWVWTGFCLVILSAALKSIPVDLGEAARVDGASEWQVFHRVTIPMLGPTIGVVVTTLVIFALKAFDIVYVMTNGNFQTEVIANRMYKEMFTFRDFGRASAIAVMLFVATLPVVVANVRRSRRQGKV